MFSRRMLLASTAALAAGCNFLNSPSEAPSLSLETELNWATRRSLGSSSSPKDVMDSLRRNDAYPYSPKQGKYQLTLRPLEGSSSFDDLQAQIENLEADLVTLGPVSAREMGERGVLLPLDRFSGADGSDFEREFFPAVLDQFRQGSLYALPVSALLEMAYFDVPYFAERGVPPMDSTWDWDDLVENASRLTQRGNDGKVTRWGLATQNIGLWWALWQNEADVLDPATLQCRLREPAAIEALQFVHDLLHAHWVSPPLIRLDLANLFPPPGIVYSYPPVSPGEGIYRLAELPQGRVHAAPVHGDLGIGIASRTEKPELAYTALRGVVHAMQELVELPAAKESIARLEEFRKDLRPEEVAAIQRSMEYSRPSAQDTAQLHTMYDLTESIVQGDDVATVVNQACSLLREYQQA